MCYVIIELKTYDVLYAHEFGGMSMVVFWFVFPIAVIIFENTVICYFIQKHFPGRFSKTVNRVANISAVAVISCIYIFYMFMRPTWTIEVISLFLFWTLYILLLRKNGLYKRCFWSALLVSINSLCAIVGVSVAMLITGAAQDVVVFDQGLFRFLLVISVKVMQLAISYYFSKFYITSSSLPKKAYIILIIITLLCHGIGLTIMYVGQEIDTNIFLLPYLVFSAICIMAVLMIAYYLYYEISKQSEVLLKTRGELQHKILMEQHNDELLKIDNNMRTWRHNIHNHLQSLAVFARAGDTEKMENYIKDLGHELLEIEKVCHTGQKALDAIVTVKYALAKAEDINFSIKVMPVAPLSVSDTDITSLLGNLLDNAIESCRRVDVKKRSIDLFLGMTGDMICIKLENVTDGFVREENGHFLTTKADTEHHGLGITSINHILSAADGILQCSHKDCVFTSTVLLPAAENSS